MTILRGFLITPDSAFAPFQTTPENSLNALQAAVGGEVDVHDSASGRTTFWFNRNTQDSMEVNHAATALWWSLDNRMAGRGVICGPVIVTGRENDETVSVGEEAYEQLPDEELAQMGVARVTIVAYAPIERAQAVINDVTWLFKSNGLVETNA